MDKYVETLSRGLSFKHEGKYEEAKNKYIEAIKIDKKNPNAYYNLGKILYILEEYEASARSYKTSFELGIDPHNVLIHLGHALLDNNSKEIRFKDAVEFYEKGVNPYILKKYRNDLEKFTSIISNQPSTELLYEYESKCILAAKTYLAI